MARILCIEDDPDLQFLVGSSLFREGYEVHYAFNGQEGYEKVLLLDPDLLLLDLMIPVMNGVEVLKRVKASKATQDIPVIIMTAYGDFVQEVNLLEHSVKALGAVEYLRKPVAVDELVRRVGAVLRKHPRARGRRREAPSPVELRKGEFRADPRTRSVWAGERLLATLPRRRFELLRLLMAAGGPVSKGDLIKALGYSAGQDNALEKSVQRLREALGSREAFRVKTTASGYELAG